MLTYPYPFIVISPDDTDALHEIRVQVWQELTDDELPDADIAMESRLGAATVEVLDLIDYDETKYNAATAAIKFRIRLSIIFRTAAILVPTLPQQTRESILNQAHDEQFAVIDWEEKVKMLNDTHIKHIDDLIPPGHVPGSGGGPLFSTFEVKLPY